MRLEHLNHLVELLIRPIRLHVQLFRPIIDNYERMKAVGRTVALGSSKVLLVQGQHLTHGCRNRKPVHHVETGPAVAA